MVPCRLAHLTVVISPSMADRVWADGLCSTGRVRLLGSGSANGVDLRHFSPAAMSSGNAVREAWQIPETAIVIGFVGRLTRDKGVDDLARAFEMIHQAHRDAVLLVVGDYEVRDRPSAETVRFLSTHAAVRHVGFQTDVVRFLAAMDLLVLPSYREGLGNVLLEAAAMTLPTVTTTATGARDATVHGKTGLQVAPGDVRALAGAIQKLVADEPLRRRFGLAGREWVSRNFDRERVWQLQASEYTRLARDRPI
jgi:glycosyltransferase involved in cell wall biosynthesis